MKSKKPKVLAEILFQPMLGYVLENPPSGGSGKGVVTGFEAEQVEAHLQYLGAHAGRDGFTGGTAGNRPRGTDGAGILQENIGTDVLVLYGDTPYLSAEVIEAAFHLQHKKAE